MTVERIAGTIEFDVVRELNRQILDRYRHRAADLAMDHRDRTAPISLSRDTPVPQAEVDLPLRHGAVAERRILQPLGNVVLGGGNRHPVEESRVDHAAVAVIRRVGDDECGRVLSFWADNRRVAEIVFVDEVEIALVVRRTAEDCAGAVIHQYEVCDIDREFPFAIERMHCLDAGVEALLLRGLDVGGCCARSFALGNERRELRIRFCGLGGKRMIRRQRQKFCAEQRVWPRREHLDFSFVVWSGRSVKRKANQQAF